MTRNADLFKIARGIIPGGVNSPARSFNAVGGAPKFIARAHGAHLWDEEGVKYVDYVGSWGPMLLGHCAPQVTEAISEQLRRGVSFGAPCEVELKVALVIRELMPSVELVRMVNSGTEACMSAIRVARAFTKRDKVIKFEGCYHGHADFFLSKAGSGLATLGEPSSAGVPAHVAATTLNARFNDVASVEKIFAGNAGEVAAVIVEPVVGNMGVVLPADDFLKRLQEICTANGALLIFDEVMTGFRVARGGAQERFDVKPDLTTLGKIVGGGLPVGAYGGRKDVMEMVAPLGPVYQAGTLSGNPLAMTAGFAQLEQIAMNYRQIFPQLERMGALLEDQVMQHARARSYPVTYARCGSMATLFFTKEVVKSWEEASRCDTRSFTKYFWSLMKDGIYMPPSQYEAFFMSTMHTEEIVMHTAEKMRRALDSVFSEGHFRNK
ncbi:glutamate-1-semialdehyde 2,1-aminomutase [Candidatus Sumerlaeota bacterium]|nr:glutamate-1-semialdehyde 2,1-aminomutase [Candidatus Sumerlaeota bacterium]